VSSDGEREQHAQSLLRSVLSRKSEDLYHPLSVMRLYVEIVDKWRDSLTQTQKISLKNVIDEAVASIDKFRQTSRFRNLPDLKKRLEYASKRLV